MEEVVARGMAAVDMISNKAVAMVVAGTVSNRAVASVERVNVVTTNAEMTISTNSNKVEVVAMGISSRVDMVGKENVIIIIMSVEMKMLTHSSKALAMVREENVVMSVEMTISMHSNKVVVVVVATVEVHKVDMDKELEWEEDNMAVTAMAQVVAAVAMAPKVVQVEGMEVEINSNLDEDLVKAMEATSTPIKQPVTRSNMAGETPTCFRRQCLPWPAIISTTSPTQMSHT